MLRSRRKSSKRLFTFEQILRARREAGRGGGMYLNFVRKGSAATQRPQLVNLCYSSLNQNNWGEQYFICAGQQLGGHKLLLQAGVCRL